MQNPPAWQLRSLNHSSLRSSPHFLAFPAVNSFGPAAEPASPARPGRSSEELSHARSASLLSFRFTSGHSEATIEYRTESRGR